MYHSEELQFIIGAGGVFFESGISSGLTGVLSAFTSSQGHIDLKQIFGTAAEFPAGAVLQ